MNLLLDTHVVVWALSNDPTLGDEAREAIIDGSNIVMVSTASVWEISIKMALGKLEAPGNLLEELASKRLDLLAVNGEHAWLAGQLSGIHQDPFDRLLVAQAQLENLALVTRDANIRKYDVRLLIA